MSTNTTLGALVMEARKKKNISARELAKLIDISHTEINNIEKGIRVKPSLLILKGFEKYLDLNFKEIAEMVGYSKESIEYADEEIIVSYEKFSNKIEEFKQEKNELLFEISKLKHIGLDIKEDFEKLKKYINSLPEINSDIIINIHNIDSLLDKLTEKYKSINPTSFEEYNNINK